MKFFGRPGAENPADFAGSGEICRAEFSGPAIRAGRARPNEGGEAAPVHRPEQDRGAASRLPFGARSGRRDVQQG
jgi:hypothetical protein